MLLARETYANVFVLLPKCEPADSPGNGQFGRFSKMIRLVFTGNRIKLDAKLWIHIACERNLNVFALIQERRRANLELYEECGEVHLSIVSKRKYRKIACSKFSIARLGRIYSVQ